MVMGRKFLKSLSVLVWMALLIFTTQTVAPQDQVTLQLWVRSDLIEEELFQEQLALFTEETGIQVELTTFDFAEFFDQLLTSAAAGEGPDTAIVSYYDAAILAENGSLAPIDGYTDNVDFDDFLSDGLSNVNFDGSLYGLPLLRFSCKPDYLNLVLLAESSYPQEVVQLMDFLTSLPPDRLAQTYEDFTWYPTRSSLYEELVLECPPANAIRPSPHALQVAQVVAQELSETLADVLGDQELNISGATIYDPETFYDPENLEESPTSVVAVPADSILSEEELKALGEDGVIIGALRIGEESVAAGQLGVTGDFVQRCYGDFEEAVTCDLISPDFGTISLTPEAVIPLESQVGQTAYYFEEGSIVLCGYLDGIKICVTIG